MKKRVVITLLSVMLLLTCCISAFAVTSFSGNVYTEGYTLARIYSTDEEVVVPSMLEGKAVYSIGDIDLRWEVMAYDGTRKITLPDTVEIIGNAAFDEYTYLREIVMSSNVKKIGYDAFRGTSISSISLPASLRSIGMEAFAKTKLTSVTLPADVVLETAEYPECGVFADCLSLKTVTLNGTKRLSEYAFAGCSSLDTVNFGTGLQSIKSGAFYGCTSLSTLNLPANLHTMDAGAFEGCTALRNVSLPAGVDTYTAPVFYGCTGLQSIDVAEENTTYRSQDGVLFSADGMTLVEYPIGKETEYMVPVGTKVIGANAFNGNTKIEVVSVAKGVERIEEGAFADCRNMRYLALPSTLTEIGENAFDNCEGLEAIFYGGTRAQWNALWYDWQINPELYFVEEPAFVRYPADDTVAYGETALLDVQATGYEIAYQWYRVEEGGDVALENDEEYRGVNTAYLIIDGERHTCERSGEDRYYCVITNIMGVEKSNEVRVFVNHKDADDHWESDQYGHWHTCYCGRVFEDNVHKGKWTTVTAATTKKEGLEKKYCSTCGYEMESRAIPVITVTTSDLFYDVNKKDWFYKNGSIDFVYNNELFMGTSKTSFSPNAPMTRGMFVTVLGRLAGAPNNTKVTTAFTDVKKGQYYTGYVKWASDNGIVAGLTAKSFGPDNNITREQISAIMVRYCGYAGITLETYNAPIVFKDASKISKYARSAVRACQMGGLVNGEKTTGGYNFRPQGNATRAEVATIIMNFAKTYK